MCRCWMLVKVYYVRLSTPTPQSLRRATAMGTVTTLEQTPLHFACKNGHLEVLCNYVIWVAHRV